MTAGDRLGRVVEGLDQAIAELNEALEAAPVWSKEALGLARGELLCTRRRLSNAVKVIGSSTRPAA